MATAANPATETAEFRASRPQTGSQVFKLLLPAVWFGVVAGLIEGAGFLAFQRINWARWGPSLHVSTPILWISAGVDVLLFSVIALVIAGTKRLFPRLPAFRMAIFIFIAATVYDWLTVPARLDHRASLLLAFGIAVAVNRWTKKHELRATLILRKTTPWVVTFALLLFVIGKGGQWWSERRAVAQLPASVPGTPNVLVIVLDTLRADHLSSYGYQRPTSPNIDRLASQGVLFENAVAPCSWSFPSHVSLVTGLYSFEHGMGNVPPMSLLGPDPNFSGAPTLGEVLEHLGYRTAAFSANRTYFSHNLGFERGFTHFEDYFHSAADMFVRTLYGREFSRIYLSRTDRSKPKRLLRWLGFDSILDPDEEGSGSYGGAGGIRKRAAVINEEVLRWIDHGPQNRRPFFAFLNYFDVHGPYGAPRTYVKPPWPLETKIDEYDGGIRYDDDFIGRLFSAFDERGLTRNTLIVITSDHGESLGQHGLSEHGKTLYWDLVHVPLVFWYPGHVPAGVRVPTPVSNAALAATIMDLIGSRADFPGPPLTDTWRQPVRNGNWPAPLSELAENKYPGKLDRSAEQTTPTATAGPMKSLVMGQYQLIMHKVLGDQLYDWVQDPAETHDMIRTPAGQVIAGELLSRMQDVLARSSVQATHADALPLDDGLHRVVEHSPSPIGGKVDDYYRFEAKPGTALTITVHARAQTLLSRLDPVISIQDASGKLLQTCRNPGDDHVPAPGISDPTPRAFDDVCYNDDIEPPVKTDSQLELLVPAAAASDRSLYLHVTEWNGQQSQHLGYEIAISGTAQEPAIRAGTQ